MYTHAHTTEAIAPNPHETEIARESQNTLAAFNLENKQDEVQVHLHTEDNQDAQFTLPRAAVQLLLNGLQEMAKGNAVTLIPVYAELTTQEAADMLNVSRPYLVELLEQGKIPFRKVGTRRRVFVNDLLHYKEKIDKARLKTLEELSAQAQELDMGY